MLFTKTRLKRRILRGIKRLTNEEIERVLDKETGYFLGGNWDRCFFGVAIKDIGDPDFFDGLSDRAAGFLDSAYAYDDLCRLIGVWGATRWCQDQAAIELLSRGGGQRPGSTPALVG